ncbi:MAG: lysine transporter LysE [Proteobacteria bacterium]|nr:lysine transporter LysE [Pseudomonadota bacterium]
MMLTAAQIAAFLPAALLLSLAPGPDNLTVLSLGLARGRSASFGFAMGCAAGCLNHTLLAALGVSAMIAASPLAFRLLQYAGAAYLLWLGWQALGSRGASLAANRDDAAGGGFGLYFRRGLIANAINPKVALFFLALLPQFVVAGGARPGLQTAALGLLFTLAAALVFGAIALGAGRIGDWLRRRPAATRWLDRAAGLVFIGLGLRLALAEAPAPR